MSIRTDLAIECIDFARETLPQGGSVPLAWSENGMTVITAVEIREEEAANRFGKPVGHYVTIETSGFEAVPLQILRHEVEADRRTDQNVSS